MKPEFSSPRLLLSGPGRLQKALDIAANLQEITVENLLSGLHTDILHLKDTGKSLKIHWSDAAKRDGQSENETMSGMKTWCHRRPVEGKYRVVIIENIARMTHVTPHAWLKLLEEPPSYVRFICTIENPFSLIDTILSRLTLQFVRNNMPESDEKNREKNMLITLLEDNSAGFVEYMHWAEEMDKMQKKEASRAGVLQVLQDTMTYISGMPALQKHLPEVWKTYSSIKQNQHLRSSLEVLGLHSLQ